MHFHKYFSWSRSHNLGWSTLSTSDHLPTSDHNNSMMNNQPGVTVTTQVGTLTPSDHFSCMHFPWVRALPLCKAALFLLLFPFPYSFFFSYTFFSIRRSLARDSKNTNFWSPPFPPHYAIFGVQHFKNCTWVLKPYIQTYLKWNI